MLRAMQANLGKYNLIGAVSVNDPVQGPTPARHLTVALGSVGYAWKIADRIAVQSQPRAIVGTIASGGYALNGIAVGLNRTIVKNKHTNFIASGVAMNLADRS